MARRKVSVALAAACIVLLAAVLPIVNALPVLEMDNELVTWKGQDSEGGPEYQVDNSKDIYLYFHRTTASGQYVLNTQGGSNGVDVLPNANSVTFQLETPLTKNLEVLGHEIDASRKGFWLDLAISAFPQATITVEVLDGTTVVANASNSFSGTWNWWTLPFVGSVDSHTFPQGSTIGVRISTTGSTTINYQTNDKLYVLCDPVSLSGDTYNINNVKTKTFQPNAIQEERHVVFRGKISDAWGAGDVANVHVNIRNPTGTSIMNATATVDGLNFTYDWNYSGGQQAGSYMAYVTMFDQQDNVYEIVLDFTMATYGVHLDSPQAHDAGIIEGSVERGGCIEYTVSVLNTGAVASSYTLSQSSSDVSGWSLSITPSQTGSVQPGESKVVTAQVCADDSVEEGTQAVFYIQAVAAGSPTAKDTIQAITLAVPKVNMAIQWTTSGSTCSMLVNTGGNVTCDFEVVNSGLQTLNVTVTMTMTKGSPDWTATVTPSSIVNTNLLLHPDQSRSGTLSVSAPDDPSKINETMITIQAEARDIDPPITKSIHATVVMSTGINLEAIDDEDKVDPGDTAEFFLIVSNTDPNNAHTITLTSVQQPGWSVEFTAGKKVFDLNAQESVNVNIKVTPASNAPAGSYDIEVTGKYQDNPQTWDKVDLTVIINEKRELKISVQPTSKKVGSGESASFTVSVENLGNIDEDSANLIVEALDGDLEATVSIDGNQSGMIKATSVPRGQTMSYVVKISPKDDSKHKDKGTYKIKIKGAGSTGPEDFKQVSVEVEKETMDILVEDIFSDFYMIVLVVLVIVVLMFFVVVARR